MAGPRRNHVEMRSSRKPARQYVSDTHDHKPTIRTTNREESTVTDRELEKINIMRKRRGLSPLTRSQAIAAVASAPSRDDDGFDEIGFLMGIATGIPISPSHGISAGSIAGAMLHSEPARSEPEPEPSYSEPASHDSGSSSDSYSSSSDSSSDSGGSSGGSD